MGFDSNKSTDTGFRESLLNISVEAWRFREICKKIVENQFPGNMRFESKCLYFFGQVERTLGNAGLRVISLEGEPYDPGMQISAINLDEFGTEDALVIDKMIEPIVMEGPSVARMGIVRLRRKS